MIEWGCFMRTLYPALRDTDCQWPQTGKNHALFTGKRVRGFSMVELLIVAAILGLVIILGGLWFRSAGKTAETVSRFNTFHLQAGILIAAMKLDLRSALEIQVAPTQLSILHVTGVPEHGALETESVTYTESGLTIREERAGKENNHVLCGDHREVVRVGLHFETANRGEELGEQTGILKITISALDQHSRLVGRLVASATVQFRTRKLSP